MSKKDFWESYVPEPVKPAQQALDKKAENARELGLDYDVKSDHRLMDMPAQQEPVAWMVDVDLANYQGQSEYRTILAWNAKPVWSGTHEINEVLKAVPLYTSPPAQRTWVGLTDEERMDVLLALNWDKQLTHMDTAKHIEAKLKEKNT